MRTLRLCLFVLIASTAAAIAQPGAVVTNTMTILIDGKVTERPRVN